MRLGALRSRQDHFLVLLAGAQSYVVGGWIISRVINPPFRANTLEGAFNVA